MVSTLAVQYERLHCYFKFLRVSIFIMVLIAIYAWLEMSIATILITHLTANGQQLPKAASVVNVQDGISAFLLLLVAYASDHPKIGSFMAVVCTTVAYIIGLLLIFLEARIENENIGSLFGAAMFIALGRSGRDIALKQFLADQCKVEWSLTDDDEDRIQRRREIYWRVASVLGVIVALCFSWIYSDIQWVDLCKVALFAMGAACIVFLVGFPFYHVIQPRVVNTESVASKLLLAALRKRHLCLTSFSDTHHIDMGTNFRWLDRAAMAEASPNVEEQRMQGRLYTVAQVLEVKKMLSIIPLWTSFLVYGLIQATANVFFYEQASYMDSRVGLISNVPVEIFVVIMKLTSFGVSYICDSRFHHYWGDMIPRPVMLIRIGLGLAIAPICFVISWRVESHRLEKYVKSDVSVSVAWLIPQFLLLGILEGLVSNGIEKFFYANVSKSFRKYGPAFTEFAPDIGHFISLLLVLNLRSLFGDNLNTSSLGLYYAILGYVCFINLMFYCYMATHFVKRPLGEASTADQVMDEIQNGEDIINRDATNQES